MTASKQHFELIARVLQKTERQDEREAATLSEAWENHSMTYDDVATYAIEEDRRRLAEAFAEALADTNDHFDRARFLAACE